MFECFADIPAGSSRHHIERPPQDLNEVSICKDDEVIFHIELRNRSLRNRSSFHHLEVATVVIVVRKIVWWLSL